MSPRRTPSGSLSIPTLVAVLCLLLTACGSSDSSKAASDPGATASSAPAGGPSPRGPSAFDQEQLDAIQKCLEAAGLGDAFPTDMPTGFPSGSASGEPPSDFPTDFPSGDLPSDLPSGGPSGRPGQGGGFGAFDDPEVQTALQACGIELPSGPSPQASS